MVFSRASLLLPEQNHDSLVSLAVFFNGSNNHSSIRCSIHVSAFSLQVVIVTNAMELEPDDLPCVPFAVLQPWTKLREVTIDQHLLVGMTKIEEDGTPITC